MNEEKPDDETSFNFDWNDVRVKSLSAGGFGPQRIEIWKALLNVPDAESNVLTGPTTSETDTRSVEEHADERQIKLDTDRSFVLYPVDDSSEKELLQHQLHELIVEVFRKRRYLSYFQGYHDIVSVLYLTLPKELRFISAEKMSLHRLRDSMGSSLEPVLALLRVLQRLLSLADPNYSELLERNSPLPYYALSNLLTLFSHDMPTLPLAQHVFDYLLARPPIACVYLAAAVLLSRKAEVELLEQEGEEGMIHSLLSSMPELFEEGEDYTHAVIDDIDDSIKEDTDDILSGLDSSLSDAPLSDSILFYPTGQGSAAVDEPLSVTLGSSKQETLIPDILEKYEDPPGDAELVSESPKPIAQEVTPSRSLTPTPPLPRRPRISMTSLLQHADLLYELYPPEHPSIALDTIMGPQSVVFTWSQDSPLLPGDDEAELMVAHPELIVLPIKEEEDGETKGASHKDEKRHRRRLHKSRRLIPLRRKTMVASAVLVLGIAVAVYGTGGFRGAGGDMHRHGHREWRSLTRFVGAIFVGAGERFFDSIWG